MRDHWHPLVQEATLKISKNETLDFRVFIDKSVLEIFVNGKLCLTHRVFPSLIESKDVTIFSVGGKIEVPEFHAWENASIKSMVILVVIPAWQRRYR